jgi:hypothetical protein
MKKGGGMERRRKKGAVMKNDDDDDDDDGDDGPMGPTSIQSVTSRLCAELTRFGHALPAVMNNNDELISGLWVLVRVP